MDNLEGVYQFQGLERAQYNRFDDETKGAYIHWVNRTRPARGPGRPGMAMMKKWKKMDGNARLQETQVFRTTLAAHNAANNAGGNVNAPPVNPPPAIPPPLNPPPVNPVQVNPPTANVGPIVNADGSSNTRGEDNDGPNVYAGDNGNAGGNGNAVGSSGHGNNGADGGNGNGADGEGQEQDEVEEGRRSGDVPMTFHFTGRVPTAGEQEWDVGQPHDDQPGPNPNLDPTLHYVFVKTIVNFWDEEKGISIRLYAGLDENNVLRDVSKTISYA